MSQSSLVPEAILGMAGYTSCAGDHISTEDRTLLQSAARAVLLSRRGSLADQVSRLERPAEETAAPAAPPVSRQTRSEVPVPRPELEFPNGLGGFAKNGREYVTTLGPGQSTPAPWLNVIANASFGFQVSESGSGYTWSEEQPREPSSPHGPTTPSAIRQARQSISGMTTAASCGVLRHSRSAARNRRMSPVTAPDTAGSSICTTASGLTSSSSSRSTTP